MNNKHHRKIGTTDKAIADAEHELDFVFPPSFREWLLENNGLGIDDISVFPVFDEGDPRKTSDSIVRNYKGPWAEWLQNFEDQSQFRLLLPFGEDGTGDYFCFDYSDITDGESVVVRWSHETGETEFQAQSFADFVAETNN